MANVTILAHYAKQSDYFAHKQKWGFGLFFFHGLVYCAKVLIPMLHITPDESGAGWGGGGV